MIGNWWWLRCYLSVLKCVFNQRGLRVSCAPKMTPRESIDFPAMKGRKSDEEAFFGRTDHHDFA